MFCGAYILSVPRAEVCIFSTGKRASTKLLELISTLVKRTPGGAERVCKQNQGLCAMAKRLLCYAARYLRACHAVQRSCGFGAARRMIPESCQATQALLARCEVRHQPACLLRVSYYTNKQRYFFDRCRRRRARSGGSCTFNACVRARSRVVTNVALRKGVY